MIPDSSDIHSSLFDHLNGWQGSRTTPQWESLQVWDAPPDPVHMTMRSNRRVLSLPVAFVALASLVFIVFVVRELVAGEPRQAPASGDGPTTLFVDTFSPGQGFATFSGETADLSYSQGGYRVRLDRPGDDALSALILPGKPASSIAATAVVAERAPIGGLVGVGCAATKDRAYFGAVDPATGGFVILRLGGTTSRLLRYGVTEEGAVRGPNEQNELQIQCRFLPRPTPRTLVRLFANRRFLAAYEDRGGFRFFRGMAVGSISNRRPLDALFTRAALQSAPAERDTPRATACDHLVAVGSLEADYQWTADSGGTRLNTPDFDSSQILRIVRELGTLASDVEADARLLGAQGGSGPVLKKLTDRLRSQRSALNSMTNAVNRGQVDPTDATMSLSCSHPEAIQPPWRGRAGSMVPHLKVETSHRLSAARSFDRRLAADLPAPGFVPDDTLPAEPGLGVDVSLVYHTYSVFGTSIEELNHSLDVHGVLIRGKKADAVTASRFETTFQPVYGPSGCGLVPRVRLNLVMTLPEWEPPTGTSRYLSNQWNQFMWDLEDHELHHAKLWIEAARRMAHAINSTPRDPSCTKVKADAKSRLERVFRTYERRQREFDRDVGAGVLPGPSLP